MEDFLTMFFATFFIWFLFLGLMVLWVIDGKIKKEQVIHALFACASAWVLALLLKYFFPTLRPFVTNGKDIGVLLMPTSGAFPSEHTIIAFALSVSVFLHDRRVGWVFLTSSALIGVARVLANVHYPIDIVGGAFLGTIVAVVTNNRHFLRIVSGKTRNYRK